MVILKICFYAIIGVLWLMMLAIVIADETERRKDGRDNRHR